MPKPLVSVVIPCYKQAHYLPQAVDSVLEQSYPNVEVIVVDDGSPDDPAQVMQRYADDPRVRLICQANQGVSAARNAGIAAAQGKYLQFLDADDWLHPSKIARQVEVLEADASIGLVYSEYYAVYGDTNTIVEESTASLLLPGEPEVFEHLPLEPDIFGTLWSGNCMALVTVLVRREWIERVGGFDDSPAMHEDYELWMRLAASGCRVRYLPDRLAYYRRHATNRSGGETDYAWTLKTREAIARRFPDQVAAAAEFVVDAWKQHARELHEWTTTQVIPELGDRRQAVEVMRQLEAVRAERNRLAEVLNGAFMRRAWRLARLYWALRGQGIVGLMKFALLMVVVVLLSPLLLAFGIVWLAYKAIVPKEIRIAFWAWRHKLLHPAAHQARSRSGSRFRIPFLLPRRLMSVESFAFDRFKRERARVCTADLRSLQCPSKQGLVSVVLPVFDGTDLVRESIDSILRQTYTNLELILVDGGSDDGTSALVDMYAARDPRVRVVHEGTQNLSCGLSCGFRFARGEYLTWTRVGDHLKADFLERMVDCLRRHPSWDMTYANMDIIGEDGQALLHSDWNADYQAWDGSNHINLPSEPSELNMVPNNSVGSAVLYRDRVPALLGDYSATWSAAEDYDYWMRVNALLTLRKADFPTPVYEYRVPSEPCVTHEKQSTIARRRNKLMVFDDFRRDFCVVPLVWFMDVQSSSAPVQQLAARLRAHIENAGHRLYDLGQLDPTHLSRLWLPAVYVRLSDDAESLQEPSAGLPVNALNVAILASGECPPDKVRPDWNLCLAFGRRGIIPRLAAGNQGWFATSDVSTLFAAVDVRARSHHLALIEEEMLRPHVAERKLSVIICAYKRHEKVIQAVRSVAAQTLPQSEYEVIVVNNDPTDMKLAPLLDELRCELFAQHPESLRLLVCPIQGLSPARNAGISEASGELCCFLDDDAYVGPEWLELYKEAFDAHPGLGLAGGDIRLNVPESRPDCLALGMEKYWGQRFADTPAYHEVDEWWEFPWGGNWCCRRQALLEIGGFRHGYGRRGRNNFGGAEEVCAGILIHRLGYRVAIVPTAEIVHDVEPHRFNWDHVQRTFTSGIVQMYQLQKDCYLPMNTSVGETLSLALRTPLDASVHGPRRTIRRHERLRKAGYRRLLRLQLRDNVSRRRESLVASTRGA